MERLQKLFEKAPVLRVARREVRMMMAHPSLPALLIAMPIALSLLFATIYRHQVVTDIPVAVWDGDHSTLSRLIVRSLDATRSIQVVRTVTGMDEAEELMRRGEIQGAVWIPQGLEEDIKRGTPASVVVYKSSFNLIVGNALLKDATAVVRTVSAGIVMRKFRSAGMTEEEALALANPIRLESNNLYNPCYNYESYFVPCLIAAMFQMLVMVAAVVPFGSEREAGTLRDVLRMADGKIGAALAGKALPQMVLHAATTLFFVGILFPCFGIPVHGSVPVLMAFMFIGTLASYAVGSFFALLFRSRLMATEAAVFLSTPAVLFSGYTFPLEAMPGIHSFFAQILPFTSFFAGFVKIYQYGAGPGDVGKEVGTACIFIGLALAGSWMMLSKVRGTTSSDVANRAEGVLYEA